MGVPPMIRPKGVPPLPKSRRSGRGQDAPATAHGRDAHATPIRPSRVRPTRSCEILRGTRPRRAPSRSGPTAPAGRTLSGSAGGVGGTASRGAGGRTPSSSAATERGPQVQLDDQSGRLWSKSRPLRSKSGCLRAKSRRLCAKSDRLRSKSRCLRAKSGGLRAKSGCLRRVPRRISREAAARVGSRAFPGANPLGVGVPPAILLGIGRTHARRAGRPQDSRAGRPRHGATRARTAGFRPNLNRSTDLWPCQSSFARSPPWHPAVATRCRSAAAGGHPAAG